MYEKQIALGTKGDVDYVTKSLLWTTSVMAELVVIVHGYS